MKKTIWTLTLIAGALTPHSEKLELKSTKGVTIERSFEHAVSVSLESRSMIVNGEEQPAPPGEMEQDISTETQITVRDIVLEMKSGLVDTLERSYLELKKSRTVHITDPRGGEHDMDSVEESGLEEQTVVFARDGDQTKATWGEGSEGDTELLESLVMTIDLEVVLPDGEPEKGDTWTIASSLLGTLSKPAGDLHFEPEEEEEEDSFGALPGGFEPPDPEYDGEIEATFLSVREEDGRRLAMIELAIDVSSFTDMSGIADFDKPETPDEAPPGMVMPDIDSMELDATYIGEGLLMWDIEAGHLASLEIECDVRRTQTIFMSMQMGPEAMEMEQVTVLSGTATWEVHFDE